MLALKVWNRLPEHRRVQIVTHIFPHALPEDIKSMARIFHHNFDYIGPDGNGEIIRDILSHCYNSIEGIKVVLYV